MRPPRVTTVDLLAPDLVGRLRSALERAGFGYDEVADLLGPTAHAALSRNETTPGLRATTGGSPLETLVRLWPLQAPVSREAADRALPGLVDAFAGAGLLDVSGGEVAGPGRRPPLRRRRPRLVGGQRPHARPGRCAHRRRRRPRPRDQLRLVVAGPADRARAVRPGPGPRHRLRRAGAAPRRARRRRGRHRRQRAGAGDDPAERRAQRGAGRRPRGQPVRAGRRRAVRPGGHQPAVRGLAGDRRAPGLPRLRAARRRGGPPGRHAGSRGT